jgi:hypothetical protein
VRQGRHPGGVHPAARGCAERGLAGPDPDLRG